MLDDSGNGWPESTRLTIEDHAGVEQTFVPVISGINSELATWQVTVAETDALIFGAKIPGALRAQITTGTGDALRPVKAGHLSIVNKWYGVSGTQSLGTVTLGPAGPAPEFDVTVTTLAPGSSATAAVTGTSPDLTLTLGIPQGAQGVPGAPVATIDGGAAATVYTLAETIDGGTA